jgi:Ca2+-binding EF-hand superfamily protein
MKFYDQDNSGTIDYEEFVRGMRDELTDRRLAMTKKCFMIMDRDRSGVINKEDIAGVYDVSRHPEFIAR